MFLHKTGFNFPVGGLLHVSGVVKDDEIRQPQHLDVHGEKALHVVKNDMASGITVVRVNGLDSFIRYDIVYRDSHSALQQGG